MRKVKITAFVTWIFLFNKTGFFFNLKRQISLFTEAYKHIVGVLMIYMDMFAVLFVFFCFVLLLFVCLFVCLFFFKEYFLNGLHFLENIYGIKINQPIHHLKNDQMLSYMYMLLNKYLVYRHFSSPYNLTLTYCWLSCTCFNYFIYVPSNTLTTFYHFFKNKKAIKLTRVVCNNAVYFIHCTYMPGCQP